MATPNPYEVLRLDPAATDEEIVRQAGRLRQRSTDEAIAAILDGLKWLELDWDGDVIYQFSRAARHREVAEQLLAAGRAYRCYATP